MAATLGTEISLIGPRSLAVRIAYALLGDFDIIG
jgi:hypothetical protein